MPPFGEHGFTPARTFTHAGAQGTPARMGERTRAGTQGSAGRSQLLPAPLCLADLPQNRLAEQVPGAPLQSSRRSRILSDPDWVGATPLAQWGNGRTDLPVRCPRLLGARRRALGQPRESEDRGQEQGSGPTPRASRIASCGRAGGAAGPRAPQGLPAASVRALGRAPRAAAGGLAPSAGFPRGRVAPGLRAEWGVRPAPQSGPGGGGSPSAPSVSAPWVGALGRDVPGDPRSPPCGRPRGVRPRAPARRRRPRAPPCPGLQGSARRPPGPGALRSATPGQGGCARRRRAARRASGRGEVGRGHRDSPAGTRGWGGWGRAVGGARTGGLPALKG